jgi:hypothetical protein
MLSSIRQSKPSSISEAALKHLIEKALDKGWIREAFHSEHERAYRNISEQDVLYGLERKDWVLAAPPDYDNDHKNWEYLIKTVNIEGEELHLKIAPNVADGTVRVITKF